MLNIWEKNFTPQPIYQDKSKKVLVEASAKMYEAYKAYFNIPVGDQGKSWALHFTCKKLWQVK